MPTIALIHSPLVGPVSWAPTAKVLRHWGWECVVPSLGGRTALPPWRELASRFVEALKSPDVDIVAGHSASGLLLPAIARGTGASALLFVEAQVPPAEGSASPSAGDFGDFLSTLPVTDGHLPPWSEWWGDGAMERLIGDGGLRRAFEAELPRLSVEWFKDEAEVPAWEHFGKGYVQLSAVFDGERRTAEASGWPATSFDGHHLSPATHPEETAEAMVAVLERMGFHLETAT